MEFRGRDEASHEAFYKAQDEMNAAAAAPVDQLNPGIRRIVRLLAEQLVAEAFPAEPVSDGGDTIAG